MRFCPRPEAGSLLLLGRAWSGRKLNGYYLCLKSLYKNLAQSHTYTQRRVIALEKQTEGLGKENDMLKEKVKEFEFKLITLSNRLGKNEVRMNRHELHHQNKPRKTFAQKLKELFE